MSKRRIGSSNRDGRRAFGVFRAGLIACFFILSLVGLGFGDEAPEAWDSYRPQTDFDDSVTGPSDSIIVRKLTVPANDATPFTFVGDASGQIFNRQNLVAGPLPPGEYVSTEQVPADWTLTSILCGPGGLGVVDSATALFNLPGGGSNVACTFTNVRNGLLFADGFELGDSAAWSSTQPSPPGLCAHSLCSEGGSLQDGCNACVTDICQVDPVCCTTSWDEGCVSEVTTVCDQPCP